MADVFESSTEIALALNKAWQNGYSGAHYYPGQGWLPCETHEQYLKSDFVKPSRRGNLPINVEDERRKRRLRKGKQWEELGERGVISIETMPGGGLVSGKEEPDYEEFEEYELIELKAGNYTKPDLRERIKNRIMAGSKGGKPGQWSARKAQLLAIEYRKAGGGYRGAKKKPQRSLDKWTDEKWTTSDGKPAIREGGTNRYLPKEAWDKLTPAQRAATNKKKRKGSRSGAQFVPNTRRARDAGSAVRNSTKSAWAPIDGDADVFTDIASARRRARQLGCIGVARRSSRGGNTVWTPCTNMTDYQKRTGSTAFGRRRREERELAILRERLKKIRRGKTLQESLSGKRLTGNLRRGAIAAQPYDPNAVDGDNDGMVQDGTAFQRPATPNIPSLGTGFASASDRRRDRRVRKLERQGRLAREGSTEREVQLMSRKERRDFEEYMRSLDPKVEDLDDEYLDWLSRNPAYADELDATERAKLPRSVQNGFASSSSRGNRVAVGSGGREMAKKILERVKPQHRDKKGQREFHFVGGTPGSGKSSLVRKGIFGVPKIDEAAHIDPDEIKTGLHGYDGGKGAQVVHSASRSVTDKTMDAANDAGMDIVVQGVGKRTEHLQWARRKGLTTIGHFAYVPGDVADQRIAQRAQAGGTVLPRNYGSHMASYIHSSVPRQITSDLYDEFFLWDNTTDTPRLIASRTRDGQFVINDDKAFDDFMGPGAKYVRNHWQNPGN